MLEVKMIKRREELESLAPFYVDRLLWGTKGIPRTYGYLGFIPGDRFCLKMVCEEQNPLRTYKENMDPVYRDSAMEAFFLFESAKRREAPPIYLNFEANGNGALLAGYGEGRMYRTYFSQDECEKFGCRAKVGETKWEFEIEIPVDILEEIYGPLELREGSRFTCNFYKISETKEIEHYASYAPLETETPSFHLPEFFAEAMIIK